MPTHDQWVRARRDQATWHIARVLIRGLLAYRESAGALGFQLEKLDDHLAGLRELLTKFDRGLPGPAPAPAQACADCGQLVLLPIPRRPPDDPVAGAVVGDDNYL